MMYATGMKSRFADNGNPNDSLFPRSYRRVHISAEVHRDSSDIYQLSERFATGRYTQEYS